MEWKEKKRLRVLESGLRLNNVKISLVSPPLLFLLAQIYTATKIQWGAWFSEECSEKRVWHSPLRRRVKMRDKWGGNLKRVLRLNPSTSKVHDLHGHYQICCIDIVFSRHRCSQVHTNKYTISDWLTDRLIYWRAKLMTNKKMCLFLKKMYQRCCGFSFSLVVTYKQNKTTHYISQISDIMWAYWHCSYVIKADSSFKTAFQYFSVCSFLAEHSHIKKIFLMERNLLSDQRNSVEIPPLPIFTISSTLSPDWLKLVTGNALGSQSEEGKVKHLLNMQINVNITYIFNYLINTRI